MFTDFKYKYIFSLILLLSSGFYTRAQTQKVIRAYDHFREVYYVLKEDTSVKYGNYRLYYKKKIIENGFYNQNNKSGVWQFFSLNGILEYEYDFDTKKVVKIAGKEEADLKQKTPCLFLGSPLIPYLFIVKNIHYPDQAQKINLGGTVILALKINKKGKLWSMYLFKKLDPVLDREVMRVAKDFPDYWQWLPATQNGESVDGQYLITIEFEPGEL